MQNTIIILGAGASKPAGVPLMNEFLMKGCATLNQGEEKKALNEFFKKIKGFEICPQPEIENGIPFEQYTVQIAKVLKKNDIERIIDEAENAAKCDKLDKLIPEKIKQFVFKTIEKCAIKQEGFNLYTKLIEKTMQSSKSTTIISFNYDTVLEGCLLTRGMASQFSYNFPKYVTKNFDSYLRDYTGQFDILKLHGSLNWLYCSTCNIVLIKWGSRIELKMRCNKCDSIYESILIAPGKKKELLPKYFQCVYDKAIEKLKQANQVIIVGYSFRTTDVKACELFSKTLSNKTNYGLTVVDCNPENILRQLAKLKVNNQILKQAEQFKGFEEYVEFLSKN